MSSVMGIDTAIGWAHWQLRGGWKTTATTCAGLAGLIIIGIFITLRMNGTGPTSNVLYGWRVALLWIEAGLLILFAGSRVAAGLRADVTNKMIESHRLMPVSHLSAVSGYLWGPTAQSIGLGGVVFLLGLVVTVASGMPAIVWIGPSAIIATFALFWWTVLAFAASITKASGGITGGLIFIGFMSQGSALMMLPGLIVLASPLHGRTIFQAQSNAGLNAQFIISVAAQAYVGSILYYGAARKYRRAEDSALAIIPAMLLLAGWVAMSALAVLYGEDWLAFMGGRGDLEFAQFIASILSAMVLGLVAVGNAAKHRRAGSIVFLTALICAIIICPFALVGHDRVENLQSTMIQTLIIIVTFLVGSGYLMTIGRFMQRRWILMFIWIVLIGVGPIIADSIVWQMSNSMHDFAITWISGLSPAGALVLLWQKLNPWTELRISAVNGLIFQSLCALGWTGLYYLTRRRTPRIAT